MFNKLTLILSNFCLLLIFVLVSFSFIVDHELIQDTSLEEFTNTYCQNNTINKTPLNSLVCKNNFKKEKFIWLLIDGFSYYQLFLLKNFSNFNISHHYRTKVHEFKQGGTIHESIFTGKFSRNYKGRRCKIDNIFTQLKQSGQKIFFRGSIFPVYSILGREKSKDIYDAQIKEHEQYPFEFFCPNAVNNLQSDFIEELKNNITNHKTKHLKREYNRTDVYQILHEHFKDNEAKMADNYNKCFKGYFKSQSFGSIAYYTDRIDYGNHKVDRNTVDVMVDLYGVETAIIGLIEWINKYHPEYALFVISDHGGQGYNGEDFICNHGCDIKGNSGIFMIYTNETKNSNNGVYTSVSPFISIYDISATISQFVLNVNIPLESIGFPKIEYNNNILKYVGLKSKEIQIKEYIEKYLLAHNERDDEFIEELKHNKYSKMINSLESIDMQNNTFFEEYQTYLKDMQKRIHSVMGSVPLRYTIIRIISLALLFFLSIRIVYTIRKLLKIYKHEKIAFIFQIALIVIFNYEAILGFFNKTDKIFSVRLIGFLLLSVLNGIYIYSIKTNEKKLFLSVIFIFIGILCFVFRQIQIYPYFLRNLNTDVKVYLMNCLANYPIFLIFLLYQLSQLHKFYFNITKKISVLFLIGPLSFIMFFLIIIQDFSVPLYFVKHTKFSLIITRIIYTLCILIIPLSFIKIYEGDDEKKEERKLVNFVSTAKIFFFLFIFFLCDEGERFLTFSIFCLFNSIFSRLIEYTNSLYEKSIYLIAIVFLGDNFYVANQCSLSYEFKTREISKSFEKNPNPLILVNSIILSIHKFKLFVLTVIFLLHNVKFSKEKIAKTTVYLINLLLSIHILCLIFLYWKLIFMMELEEMMKFSFWIMGKCLILLIFDILFIFYSIIYRISFGHFSNLIKNSSYEINASKINFELEMRELTQNEIRNNIKIEEVK